MAQNQVDAVTDKIGEVDISHPFDLEEWIMKYQLIPIKQCFIEYDMNTLETLTMSNKNFSKLMSDQRVLMKSRLIPNIINGIQSLEEIKNEQKAKLESVQRHLVFMTSKEEDVFIKFQGYIEELKEFKQQIEENIYNRFEHKKLKNKNIITKYQQQNAQKLDEMANKIDKIFDNLRELLDQRQWALHKQIEGYKGELSLINIEQDLEIKSLDDEYKNVVNTIEEDEKYYAQCVETCKSIIREHDDTHKHDQFDFKSKNEDRERDLVKKGDQTTKYHDERVLIINSAQNSINTFIKKQLEIEDPNNNNFCQLKINDKAYHTICSNLQNIIDLSGGIGT